MDSAAPCLDLSDARYSVFTLAPGVDGITFYEYQGQAFQAVPATIRPRMTIGEPCAHAVSRNACLAKVEVTTRERGRLGWVNFNGRGYVDFAIVTRGNDVIRVSSADELAQVVGPIDREPQAVALVQIANDGPSVVCGAPNVTATATGFLVKALQGDGCERDEVLYAVSREGVITRNDPKRITTCSEPSGPTVVEWWVDDDDTSSDDEAVPGVDDDEDPVYDTDTDEDDDSVDEDDA